MRKITPLAAPLLCLVACGFRANTNVKSDQSWTEITRHRGVAQQQPVVPPTTPTATTPPPAKRRQPTSVLAVFDIEDRGGGGLSAATLTRLSDYLAMTVAAAGRFRVVPRDQLKERLKEQKKQSFKKCYDQSCQIEVGRELAAQKTLSTVLIKLGKRCTVTAVLYDLRRAASEGGATAEGACSEDGVVASLKAVVRKLSR